MKGYQRTIILPSNGLLYNNIISVTELRVDYFFILENNFYTSSDTEHFLSLFSQHVFIDIKYAELLYSDAFYIWSIILSGIEEFNKLEINSICKYCNEKNNIKISYADMDVKYYTKNNFPELNKTIVIKLQNEISLIFNRRLLKHNLISGVNIIDLINDNFISNDMVYEYLEPQLNCIIYKNETINSSELLDLIKNNTRLKNRDLIKFVSFDEFGLQQNFKYKCQKCAEEQSIDFMNPFNSSLYSFNKTKDEIVKKLIEEVMFLVKFGNVSFDSVMSLPYSKFDNIYKGFNDVLKKSGLLKEGSGLGGNPMVAFEDSGMM